MTLTKVRSLPSGSFEYINLETVDLVDVLADRYQVYLSAGSVLDVDLTDPAITAAIGAADTAYGA